MCAGEWEAINFNHVPALAHHRSKKMFMKHQPERYAQYQRDLEEGKAKINTTGLQPHLLVEQYLASSAIPDPTIEAQWRTIIADLKDSGNFGSTLAVVDVSGSMAGIPMVVAITLGMIVSELSAPPFQGRLLTFSEVPEWHNVQGMNLFERVRDVARMKWGMTTNLHKVHTHLAANQVLLYLMPMMIDDC